MVTKKNSVFLRKDWNIYSIKRGKNVMNIIQSLLIVFLVFCSTTVLLVTISTFIMLYDDIKYKYGYYEEGGDEEWPDL